MGTVIYGIIDPRTNQLFYIGKAKDLPARIWAHRSAGRANVRQRCARKIRGILAANLQPDFFIIEDIGDGDWVEAEQFWIAYFKSIGCDLANHTIGGEGLTGMRHSKEAIAKTVAAHLGAKRSEETKARIKATWTPERKAEHIAFCKTRVMPDHQRALLSKVHKGKKISDKQKAQIGAFFRGRRQTEEQKRKSGAGIKAAWTDQRRKEQGERLRALRAGQTHCKRGHPLSGDNLYVKPTGARICIACRRAWLPPAQRNAAHA